MALPPEHRTPPIEAENGKSTGSPSVALRDDEAFVITSIANSLSGTWRPGEDPPDAYLSFGIETVAVEISILSLLETGATC
jgi:hypothetical protein